jgi:hypothetical protein
MDKVELKIQLHGQKQSNYLDVYVPCSELLVKKYMQWTQNWEGVNFDRKLTEFDTLIS